ncbi:hypothetical protein PMIN01_05056 [Paraphaeosphaeria minitans]|uniref:Uncharacterized protein n=1 Tax=Paraphaeosphaeria minitans TaxID=565426 RepID=A0A9P6GKE4_9PLEO|nr:hypothetical protein PMIN01_05056 [Paraphaeosphaeria minitans]
MSATGIINRPRPAPPREMQLHHTIAQKPPGQPETRRLPSLPIVLPTPGHAAPIRPSPMALCSKEEGVQYDLFVDQRVLDFVQTGWYCRLPAAEDKFRWLAIDGRCWPGSTSTTAQSGADVVERGTSVSSREPQLHRVALEDASRMQGKMHNLLVVTRHLAARWRKRWTTGEGLENASLEEATKKRQPQRDTQHPEHILAPSPLRTLSRALGGSRCNPHFVNGEPSQPHSSTPLRCTLGQRHRELDAFNSHSTSHPTSPNPPVNPPYLERRHLHRDSTTNTKPQPLNPLHTKPRTATPALKHSMRSAPQQHKCPRHRSKPGVTQNMLAAYHKAEAHAYMRDITWDRRPFERLRPPLWTLGIVVT